MDQHKGPTFTPELLLLPERFLTFPPFAPWSPEGEETEPQATLGELAPALSPAPQLLHSLGGNGCSSGLPTSLSGLRVWSQAEQGGEGIWKKDNCCKRVKLFQN